MIKKTSITKEKVERLQEELEDLQLDLSKIRRSRGNCRTVIEGEDNSELLSILGTEAFLVSRINDIKKVLDNCVIVDLEKNSEVVSIGAVVTVEVLAPDEDEPFLEVITLTEDNSASVEDGVLKFTIDSPIGECIIGKTIGFVGEYVVKATKRFGNADRHFTCKILDIKYPELA